MSRSSQAWSGLAALAAIPWCCVLPAVLSLLSLTGTVAAGLWLSSLNWVLLPLSMAFLGRGLWLVEVRRQGRPLIRWVTWATAALVVALWAPRVWVWVATCQRGASGLGETYGFVRFLGETGTEPGQFREPMGVALGAGGELYVADTRNRRVQVFSPEGDFLRQWGAEGDGPGEFGMPVDVAVASDGSVYVSDYELDRVQKFNAEGTFLLGWGEAGEEIGQFDAPAGLFVGPERKVYVADFYNHHVQTFGPAGEALGAVGREGHGRSELYYPTDVALDAAGDILVADAYNHRLHTLARDGGTVRDWGGKWTGALGIGPFKVPTGVAVDPQGRIHVADSANKRAVLLDADGNLLSEWQLDDDAHPDVYSPTRVAASAGRAYFVDTSNYRIVVLEVNR